MTDMDTFCRTCMKNNVILVDLFIPYSGDDNKKLVNLLMACTSVQVSKDDGLPHNVCESCVQMLHISYTFRNQAHNSDLELRKLLQKNVKEEVEVKIEDLQDDYFSTYGSPDCTESFQQTILDNDINIETTDTKLHKCEINSENYSTDIQLLETDNIEIKTENPEIYTCLKCGIVFNKRRSLAMHLKKHKPKINDMKQIELYKCNICEKEFAQKLLLKRHMKLHKDDNPYKCVKCPQMYSRQDQLAEHMHKHDGFKPNVCPYCKKAFSQLCTLKDHLRTHTGEKPFLCSECGKGFNNNSNLRQHMMRHSGIKSYRCNLCPKAFCTKGQMKSHLSTHTGAHPYKCDECDRAYTKPNSLKKHKLVHQGLRPFVCDTCSKSFTSKDHLKRHYRIHTGEKPYRCKFCDRSYSQSNDLVKHMRGHVGEKIYSCTVCEMKFRLMSELKKHYPTHYVDEGKQPLLMYGSEGDVTQEGGDIKSDGRITITFNSNILDKNGVAQDITIDIMPEKS